MRTKRKREVMNGNDNFKIYLKEKRKIVCFQKIKEKILVKIIRDKNRDY
jgi:hypothetical protein